MNAKAKTQTELRNDRLKWAGRLDELEELPIGLVRTIAAEVATGRIERGTESVTVNKAKKTELIAAITDICKEQEKLAELTRKAANVVDEAADYVAEIDRREEMADLIKQTWAKLEQYVDSRWNAVDEYYQLDNSTVVSIVGSVSKTIDSWTSKKTTL